MHTNTAQISALIYFTYIVEKTNVTRVLFSLFPCDLLISQFMLFSSSAATNCGARIYIHLLNHDHTDVTDPGRITDSMWEKNCSLSFFPTFSPSFADVLSKCLNRPRKQRFDLLILQSPLFHSHFFFWFSLSSGTSFQVKSSEFYLYSPKSQSQCLSECHSAHGMLSDLMNADLLVNGDLQPGSRVATAT